MNAGRSPEGAPEFTPLRIERRMEIVGVNPYVRVTAEEAALLQPGWRSPMPVLVQVNGKPGEPWRINMMPMGDGSFYFYLHGDVRKASRTGVGDVVTVDVAFDEDYRGGPQHPMPDSLRTAIEADEVAMRNWNALIPSRQKEILRYFASLKSDEARERNLARVIHVLSGHEARFMGRAWVDGR